MPKVSAIPYFPPASLNVPEHLKELEWERRSPMLGGKVLDQYVVYYPGRQNVMGSGFSPEHALQSAERRWAYDRITPEHFDPRLKGMTFGVDMSMNVVMHLCLDANGVEVGRAIYKEAAAKQALRLALARQPVESLSLEDFSQIAVAVCVQKGRGRGDLPYVYAGDASEGDGLREVLRFLARFDPSVLNEGEDIKAFVSRTQTQLLSAINFGRASFYVGRLEINSRAGEAGALYLVFHQPQIYAKQAIAYAHRVEVQNAQAQCREQCGRERQTA